MRRASAICFIATAAVVALPAASAQPAGDGLTDTQRPDAGICPVVRRLPSAAVDQRTHLRSGAVQGHGQRQRRDHSRRHQRRHPAHARLQVLSERPEIDAIIAYLRTVPPPAASRASLSGRPTIHGRNAMTNTSKHPVERSAAAACVFRLRRSPPTSSLSGAIASAVGREARRRHGLRQARRHHDHHQRLYRRAGQLLFPADAAGKYDVWAQALAFETTKSEVDLSAREAQDLVLKPMTDPERRWRQLPGEMMVAALPEETAEDARIKKIFTNNCTGCHAPSYVLQFRFDEDGWSKIIDLMKVVANTGVRIRPIPSPMQIIDFNQKELAAYLARVRGPGESALKIKDASASVRRGRPRGLEALRCPAQSRRRHRSQCSGQRRHRLVARHALQDRPHHP